MTTLPLNGVRLRVRLIEVELSRLKLDPENPRLHSAYLTHDLLARPNKKTDRRRAGTITCASGNRRDFSFSALLRQGGVTTVHWSSTQSM